MRYGVGYDNIDVAAASRVGVPVTIVPDTKELAVATWLAGRSIWFYGFVWIHTETDLPAIYTRG